MILLKHMLFIHHLEEISQLYAPLLILEAGSSSVKNRVEGKTLLFKQMKAEIRETDTASDI